MVVGFDVVVVVVGRDVVDVVDAATVVVGAVVPRRRNSRGRRLGEGPAHVRRRCPPELSGVVSGTDVVVTEVVVAGRVVVVGRGLEVVEEDVVTEGDRSTWFPNTSTESLLPPRISERPEAGGGDGDDECTRTHQPPEPAPVSDHQCEIYEHLRPIPQRHAHTSTQRVQEQSVCHCSRVRSTDPLGSWTGSVLDREGPCYHTPVPRIVRSSGSVARRCMFVTRSKPH